MTSAVVMFAEEVLEDELRHLREKQRLDLIFPHSDSLTQFVILRHHVKCKFLKNYLHAKLSRVVFV